MNVIHGKKEKENENIVAVAVQDSLVLNQIAVQNSEGYIQWGFG